MEGRLDGRLSVVENNMEAMEIAVDEIKAENVAVRQDTMAIRQDLQEVMRILGGRASQASVNANRRARREDEIGGRDGERGESHSGWRKRVELPLFEGLDPLNWINRAKKFSKCRASWRRRKILDQGLENEGQEPILGRVEGCVGNEVWGSKQRVGLVRPRIRGSGGADEGVTGGITTREDIRNQVRIQDSQALMVVMRIAREMKEDCMGNKDGCRRRRCGGDVESNRSSEDTKQNRCAEMVDARKKMAKLDVERSVEERNLLSVGYKNVVGSRRVSWRILSSIEQNEESKGNELNVKGIGIIGTSAIKIILDEHLIPSTNIAGPKMFYYKMKGYHTAATTVERELQPTHSIRLGDDYDIERKRYRREGEENRTVEARTERLCSQVTDGNPAPKVVLVTFHTRIRNKVTGQEHPDTIGGAMTNGLRESFRIIDTLSTGNDYIALVKDLRCRRLEVNRIQEE
ncbi:hypothetical protein V8G54_005692 [Vigna mungo]|uniref:14-3-3 domain-containing protein n=1 Tax=Vigna mungo TaxID=3915 RepID=A0AAQ3NZQ6_VIGMU